ncbi:hypothetical protein GCM10011609_78120 [Lentzea pudingi]|uniref:Tetratricopeptide repeat-containing protein n=1 Tax=Lentzea pudingi TaxID=1789439 RepID=A0ABQ2IT22_9PSEU|nr:tetratricopeptide repeat protein [Lentzea pudingi]GGN24513.1 hypothetical protein GCM10011609_78120 [Lentzea pudingi]
MHVGSPGDSPYALANPIIATVHVEPSLTSLFVDDDPPREMARGGDRHVITVEARTTRAVVLLGLRPVVVSRRPPRRACVEVRIGGFITPRPFTADFDSDRPRLTALRRDFPFSVSATDVELFHFTPHVSTSEVGWRLELDWLVAGVRGTTVIDDDGEPFGLYPPGVLSDEGHESDLSWGCGMFHLPGCPAERLAALSRPGSPEVRPDRLDTVPDLLAAAPAEDPVDEANWPAYEEVAPRVCVLVSHTPEESHEPKPFRALALRVLDYLNASGQSELGATTARALQRAWGIELGGNHRDTLAVANRLAGYLFKLGDRQQAYFLFESTYRRRVRALGEDDPDTLTSAANLAMSLSLHGISDRVRRLRADILRRSRRALGEDHRDTLTAAAVLGHVHLADEDYEAARALLSDTRRRAERVLGPHHHVTHSATRGLASALKALGETYDS